MEGAKVKDRRHLILLAILVIIIIVLLMRKLRTFISNQAPFHLTIPNLKANFGGYGHEPWNLEFPGSNRYDDTSLCGCGPCGAGRRAPITAKDFADPLLVYTMGRTVDPVFLNLYQPIAKPPAPTFTGYFRR